MSGQKIIDGIKDAIEGNFARVTVAGQVWVRLEPDHTVIHKDELDKQHAVGFRDGHQAALKHRS